MGPQKKEEYSLESLRFSKESLLRRRDVEKRIGLARSSLYRLLERRSFPEPIRIGKSVRWLETEILQWMQEQIETSRRAVA